MLPVYTRFLTPADYGLVQLLELTVEVAAIFFTAGTTAGLQRFYFKAIDRQPSAADRLHHVPRGARPRRRLHASRWSR